MRKGGITYIVIAVITVGLLMLLQYNRPKEVNWFPSYVSTHKIPYGTIVLHDIMDGLFGDKIRPVYEPPFEFMGENPDAEGTYFFVNHAVEFGEAELDRLLNWTSKGNTLFLASSHIEKRLLDTLHLEIGGLYGGFNEKQSQRHRLPSPNLDLKKGYIFDKDDYANYFRMTDSTRTGVIGTVATLSENDSVEEKKYNVIQRNFGKGEIILSTFPKALTNYFILKDDNKDYTAGLLSYLDASRDIYMDNHYKTGKSVYTSPMYIFLNTKELKWAYYMVLIGALIYVIFEGKRKQRAVPVLTPLKNQTLAFTRTIADMYYEKKEAKPIVEHKIAYFLEYIRSRFHLGTIEREADFYRNLASRSAHSVEEIERLFSFLEQLRNQETVSNHELRELNASLDKFKKRAETA